MKPLKMKTKIIKDILLIALLFLVTGCPNPFEDGSEIEWMTGTYISYNYRMGVLSGFTANIKFEVIDNTSGEIQMKAEYEGQGQSCTSFVEAGKVYKAVVVCGISSTQKNGEVIVDCPTVAEPYKISTDVKTGVSSISIAEL